MKGSHFYLIKENMNFEKKKFKDWINVKWKKKIICFVKKSIKKRMAVALLLFILLFYCIPYDQLVLYIIYVFTYNNKMIKEREKK